MLVHELDPALAYDPRPPGGPHDASGVRRRRPLFWLALSFAAGIALDDAVQPGLPVLGGSVLALILTAATGWFVLTTARRRRAAFALGLLAGLAGGALTHALHARFPDAHEVTRRTSASPSLAWIEGTVADVRRAPEEPERTRFTIELEALGRAPEELTPACGRVLLAGVSDEWIGLAEGDRVRALARLEAPRGSALPGAYDFARRLAREGVARVGQPAAGTLSTLGAAPWYRLDLHLRAWSGTLAARNERIHGTQRAGLLNALLLGRREGLDRNDREAFARAGTAHLLAISGLHIQFIALALYWLLLRGGLGRRTSALAVLLGAGAFGLLAGAQPPVVRAVLTIGVYAGGLVLRRSPEPLSALGAAALAILLWQPGELFLAGFQLSFLAVLALVTLYPSLEAAWVSWKGVPETWIADPGERAALRWRQRLRQSVFVSLAAWTGTAPVVAWHMGYFAWPSVLANLFALPLAALSMGAGFFAMLPGIEALAPYAIAPLEMLMGFNRLVAAVPGVAFDVPPPRPELMALFGAALAALWALRGQRRAPAAAAVLLPLALVAVAAGSVFQAPAPAPRVTVFDLARGRAALVETPGGEAALVDAGGEGEGRVIAESLRRAGLREIGLLVLTEDEPGAVGGAAEMLARMRVRRAVVPRGAARSAALHALLAELEARGIPHGPASLQEEWSGPGDVRWRFASDAPPDTVPRAGSEALAVRLSLPGGSMLFVHARSRAGMQRMLQNHRAALSAGVLRLVPGHDGWLPPETGDLLAACGARTVICGKGAFQPSASGGFNLAAHANREGLRLLAPDREGTLRLGAEGAAVVEAYRDGSWRHMDEMNRR